MGFACHAKEAGAEALMKTPSQRKVHTLPANNRGINLGTSCLREEGRSGKPLEVEQLPQIFGTREEMRRRPLLLFKGIQVAMHAHIFRNRTI